MTFILQNFISTLNSNERDSNSWIRRYWSTAKVPQRYWVQIPCRPEFFSGLIFILLCLCSLLRRSVSYSCFKIATNCECKRQRITLRNKLLIKRMRADQNWWRSLLFGSHLFLVLMNYTLKKKVEGKEAPYFEVAKVMKYRSFVFSLYLSWFPSPLKLSCRQLKLIWWIFSRSQLSICNLLALRSIYENNKNFAIKEPWDL